MSREQQHKFKDSNEVIIIISVILPYGYKDICETDMRYCSPNLKSVQRWFFALLSVLCLV